MLPSLQATILTIFPEIFPGPLGISLAGSALKQGIWSLDVINIRDFGRTKHKNVDDTSYGGGGGLVMRPDVLGEAIDHALLKYPDSKIFYPSPRGKPLTQKIVKEIAQSSQIIIICGRFEGIDERIIDEYSVVEISNGDHILSGGEIAALAMLDCTVRLLPGVLANQARLETESFEQQGKVAGLLECPLYTKPAEWRGRKVPDILLSGHHQQLQSWRFERSMAITRERRPDLITISEEKKPK